MAYNCLGCPVAGGDGNAVPEGRAKGDANASNTAEQGYELAPHEAQPEGLSRTVIISVLQQAASKIFYEDQFEIKLDINGCFQVAVKDGFFLISDDGIISGSGVFLK